jgi:hypothetical protein
MTTTTKTTTRTTSQKDDDTRPHAADMRRGITSKHTSENNNK